MFYLIGKTLKHSYSKEIHSFLGNNDYKLLEFNKEEFQKFILEKNYEGLNITVPYKVDAMSFVNDIGEEVKHIGSINTIVNKNNLLVGYNTDYYGIEIFFNKFLPVLKNKSIIVLGNGGIGKALIYFLDSHFLNYKIVKHHSEENIITYDEAKTICKNFEVIINTSPVGMYPNIDQSPIELEYYPNIKYVFDLIANPLETKLMKEAKKRNIPAYGGLEILVAQAKKAEELFFNTSINDEVIKPIAEKIKNLMEKSE